MALPAEVIVKGELSHLKEELALVADKWLWVISTTVLLRNSYITKEPKGTKAVLNLTVCIAMWPLVTYFEIVSSVTFLAIAL